jgi:hypothetical protein
MLVGSRLAWVFAIDYPEILTYFSEDIGFELELLLLKSDVLPMNCNI